MNTVRLTLDQINRAAIDGADKMKEYAKSVDALRSSLEQIEPTPERAIVACDKLAIRIGACYDEFLTLAAVVLRVISNTRRDARKAKDATDQQ